ncbi:MAG: ergothioneine biosynthesis protein EgtB [Actinomycetota bacterium]|nr:ergothioneine biosynthesis protein EgtB [Actinomycetota bacterium]
MDLTRLDLKEAVADELEAVRRRSIQLLEPLDESNLVRQHSPIMSPLVWDLAHVGNFEELWLLRAVNGDQPIDAGLDDVYDAFRHPRPNRPSLPLLSPAETRRYLAEVRGRALDVLDRVGFAEDTGSGGRLLHDAFVYGMVVQHEHQHDETMLATIQLIDGEGYRPLVPAPFSAAAPAAAELRIAAGPFVLGTDTYPWAYDNERPAHVVDLPAFWIDTTPVTNRRYLDFVHDGGYSDRRWWDDEGWAWRAEGDVEHPQFWAPEGSGSWSRTRFGWHEELPLDEPVQHVSWHEASAFARWDGRRLPTEAEWEKAASWAADGNKRLYPWGDDTVGIDGRANLGQQRFGPAPVGAYPNGVSAYGCHQMVGDVWEWTSSEFEPYSGFASFPYREYSEVFFGAGYKVLRGGSWATHPAAVRNTFRNWDHPIRRQIFTGFRCARDDT